LTASPSEPTQHASDKTSWAFLIIIGGIILMIAGAFALGYFFRTPPLQRFHLDKTMPMPASGLSRRRRLSLFSSGSCGLSAAPWRRSASHRSSFWRTSDSNLRLRASRSWLSAQALAKKSSLEAFCRNGWWVGGYLPLWAALLITNFIFGLLHARTALYAVIAGLVGVYLGVVYVVTDNLLAPIITHTLYDAVALELARRAIAQRAQTRIAE
jgi:membrane protease YdiL (CAAX protease family)